MARGSGARETDGRARSKAVREREPPARPHAKLPKPKTASGPFHFPRSREVWPPSWKPRPLGHYSRVGPCAGHLATEGLLGTPGSLRPSGNRQACGAAGKEQVKCSPWDRARPPTRPRTDLRWPRPNLHSRPPPESTHTAPRSAQAARPSRVGPKLWELPGFLLDTFLRTRSESHPPRPTAGVASARGLEPRLLPLLGPLASRASTQQPEGTL